MKGCRPEESVVWREGVLKGLSRAEPAVYLIDSLSGKLLSCLIEVKVEIEVEAMTPQALSSVQPAYPPPGGVVSNFVDPEDHSGIVYRVGYGFTIAAFVVLVIRLYTRLFVLKRGLLPDDYLVIVAMALSVGFIITTFKAAEYDMGRHLYDVPFDEYSPQFLIISRQHDVGLP